MDDKNWRFCVVGNIVAEHLDQIGAVRYGTKAWSGKYDGMKQGTIYTVGYTSFANSSEALINALKSNHIHVLIDVRSSPYSAYYTEFNRESLESALNQAEIYYRNYSMEFGARQEDLALYPNGYLDFELFAKTDRFKNGVTKIENSVNQGYNICFMCAEKEPVSCHRSILVSRAFSDMGYEIIHILPDNKRKTQKDVETELLSMHPRSLFDELDDDLIMAYRKQNIKIGFKAEDL